MTHRYEREMLAWLERAETIRRLRSFGQLAFETAETFYHSDKEVSVTIEQESGARGCREYFLTILDGRRSRPQTVGIHFSIQGCDGEVVFDGSTDIHGQARFTEDDVPQGKYLVQFECKRVSLDAGSSGSKAVHRIVAAPVRPAAATEDEAVPATDGATDVGERHLARVVQQFPEGDLVLDLVEIPEKGLVRMRGRLPRSVAGDRVAYFRFESADGRELTEGVMGVESGEICLNTLKPGLKHSDLRQCSLEVRLLHAAELSAERKPLLERSRPAVIDEHSQTVIDGVLRRLQRPPEAHFER
jgi:hypothetical protein